MLVVEDERTLAASVRYNLERDGYEVLEAADGLTALVAAERDHPDLIVLDLMLPGMDGLEVCRRVRTHSNVPVLMLTARADETDRVVGLEVGADDYLTKPFGMRELIARVRALLRRSGMAATPPPPADRLESGDLVVDLGRGEASRGGRSLRLKPKEFDLLAHFVRNPGRVLSRTQILDAVWGHDFFGDERTVDVHVRWLREKIEPEPPQPVRIVTVRGRGYRFDA